MESHYGKDKLEFQQIVLAHIKRILDISTHELRNGTQIVNAGNYTQTTFQEDTRYSYIWGPFFERLKKQGIYTRDVKQIQKNISDAGLTDIFEKKLE